MCCRNDGPDGAVGWGVETRGGMQRASELWRPQVLCANAPAIFFITDRRAGILDCSLSPAKVVETLDDQNTIRAPILALYL